MENTNKIKVQIEVEDYDDNYYKFDDFTLLHKSVCQVLPEPKTPTLEEFESFCNGEPCPAPRTPIGEIDGDNVYEDQVTYHIDLSTLIIWAQKAYKGFNLSESKQYSRSYLTPEAVNARLKGEVFKKAWTKLFTVEDVNDWFTKNDSPDEFIDYAIELIEKEYQVKYLNH